LVTAYGCVKFYGLLPLIGIPEDPSALMESHGLQFFFYSLGVIGLIEEFFKFLPFILITLRLKAFDEIIDGIVYASTIALGFASFENIYYLAHLEGLELFGRAFASPLSHTIFSSIWGYTVGKARIQGKSMFKASLIGLLIAAAVHGIFDFFTISPPLRVVASLIILVIWIWRIRVMEKSSREKK
jgi:RsiW-degrading membrane proteinase PrsW (M82 family)